MRAKNLIFVRLFGGFEFQKLRQNTDAGLSILLPRSFQPFVEHRVGQGKPFKQVSSVKCGRRFQFQVISVGMQLCERERIDINGR